MTTTTQDAATPPPMIVGRRGRALVALLALAGLLLMLYPSAAMWFSDREQYAAMIEQQRQVEELGPFGRAEALASANRYNQLLDERSLVDPYTGQLPDLTSLDYQAYLSELDLAADPTMGRLLVPSIDVDLPIYHGTTDATLRRGVGHLFGSALPVGGIGNHPILTAHAGLPESMLFTRLEDLVIGDEFEIVVYNEHLRYRVTSIEVILPNRSDKLLPVAGKIWSVCSPAPRSGSTPTGCWSPLSGFPARSTATSNSHPRHRASRGGRSWPAPPWRPASSPSPGTPVRLACEGAIQRLQHPPQLPQPRFRRRSHPSQPLGRR